MSTRLPQHPRSLPLPLIAAVAIAGPCAPGTAQASFGGPSTSIMSVDSVGKPTLVSRHGTRDTWHVVVPGRFDHDSAADALFYDRINGAVEIRVGDGQGGLEFLRAHPVWGKRFDLVVPGNFAGSSLTDVFFYDRRGGSGLFCESEGTGNLLYVKKHTGMEDWDVILAGDFSANPYRDLFCYSRARGIAEFWATDGSGGLTLLRRYPMRRTWDVMVTGTFDNDGHTDLLWYSRVSGETAIMSVDGQTNLHVLSAGKIDPRWDEIVAGDFDGSYTDLLCYDRRAGRLRLAASDGQGGLTWGPQRSFGRGCFRLVGGAFLSGWPTDLLCYWSQYRVRIHAVRLADDDGAHRARVSPSEVEQWVVAANEIYSDAGVQFDFDPDSDFQDYRHTLLNRRASGCAGLSAGECDAATTAANSLACDCLGKLVVFFRHDEGKSYSSYTGKWVMISGAFEDITTRRYYMDPTTPRHGDEIQDSKLLAHELGHYLGIPHQFVEPDYATYSDPHLAVVDFLRCQKDPLEPATLDMLDQDRLITRVFDTPPDVGPTFFLRNDINPADIHQDIRIRSVEDQIDLTFNPDRHNVMSYFPICDDYVRITPDQVRRVREWLHQPHRIHLITAKHGSFAPFGSGCHRGQMLHSASGCARIGQTLAYELQAAAPDRPGIFVLGKSIQSWGRIPLPLDLGALGAPGCHLYCDQTAAVRVRTSGSGGATLLFTLPPVQSLIGTGFYSQFLVMDPGANALGLATSNGLRTIVGS